MKSYPHRTKAPSRFYVFEITLLILLIGSSMTAMTIRPVGAQTASMTEVQSPSMVRAGDSFWVNIYGEYETNTPMRIDVNIVESGGGGLGTGTYEVTMEPGDVSIHEGSWMKGIEIEAYSPTDTEYDDEGRFIWELEARLPAFASNMPFTVTIIQPDAAPYVEILQATPIDASQVDFDVAPPDPHELEPSVIYTGSFLLYMIMVEYSNPPDTTIKFLQKNSLERYPPETAFEDEWAIVDDTVIPDSQSIISYAMCIGGVSFEPVDEWRWEFRVILETAEGDTAEDVYSTSIPVLEREDRSAFIYDLVYYPHPVLRAEEFNVEIMGGYVFPTGTGGDLHLRIVYAEDGSTVPGGEEITMSDLAGSGPFSQVFTLTAPELEGSIRMIAVLTMSDNPLFRDERSFSPWIEGAGVVEDFFLRITDIEVNDGALPQEVYHGESFTVQVEVTWSLPTDSTFHVIVYDWDSMIFPIGFGRFPYAHFCGSEGSETLVVDVNGRLIPPRNGPWTLRAAAYYSEPTRGDNFTPDGYERIFDVNIVGADEAIGGSSDWRINSIWTTPVDPFMGNAITFMAEIGVETADPLPQAVEVAYALDGIEQLRDTITYEGGDFLTVSSLPWIPTLGSHTIRWEVDPEGWYDDPNRANNVVDLTFTVSDSPPLPPGWEPTPEEEQEEFDFYFTVTPPEQILASSVSYTIQVEKVSGPPNPVQIQVEGLPPSVSYKIEPASGNPDTSFPATLTLTAASNIPAGTYHFNIKAVGDGRERYQSASFIVNVGPDYSINVQPRTLRVFPGETLECTVKVFSDNGYDSHVNLMVIDLPDGVTSQLDSSAGRPDFQTILHIKVSEDATPGTYTFTLSGSGVDSKHVILTLFVREKTPTPPTETKPQERSLNYYLPLAYILIPLAAIIVGVVFAVRRIRMRRVKPARFCIECGKPVPKGIKFCPECGVEQKE